MQMPQSNTPTKELSEEQKIGLILDSLSGDQENSKYSTHVLQNRRTKEIFAYYTTAKNPKTVKMVSMKNSDTKPQVSLVKTHQYEDQAVFHLYRSECDIHAKPADIHHNEYDPDAEAFMGIHPRLEVKHTLDELGLHWSNDISTCFNFINNDNVKFCSNIHVSEAPEGALSIRIYFTELADNGSYDLFEASQIGNPPSMTCTQIDDSLTKQEAEKAIAEKERERQSDTNHRWHSAGAKYYVGLN